MRMKREDDYGMNEDSNLNLEPYSVRASIKEDSQRTTTLTDNKKETTKTKELQCMKTHALASTTLACFPSVSGHFTLLGFALYFVSSILIVALTIYSILTCTRIPCRDSHCGTGLLRYCLYIEILGVTGMHSLRSVLWSTGTSVVFCPSAGSPLLKTHSSTKALLNESPTRIQKGFH